MNSCITLVAGKSFHSNNVCLSQQTENFCCFKSALRAKLFASKELPNQPNSCKYYQKLYISNSVCCSEYVWHKHFVVDGSGGSLMKRHQQQNHQWVTSSESVRTQKTTTHERQIENCPRSASILEE